MKKKNGETFSIEDLLNDCSTKYQTLVAKLSTKATKREQNSKEKLEKDITKILSSTSSYCAKTLASQDDMKMTDYMTNSDVFRGDENVEVFKKLIEAH